MKAAIYLRQQTALLHRRTEELAYVTEIKTASLQQHQYQDLLQKNEYIHRQLESYLLRCMEWKELSEFAPFLKLRHNALLADLQHLALPVRSFSCSFADPNSPAAALGVLYTLTGSRLGGRMILKALKLSRQLATSTPFHFYSDKPPLHKADWQAFCNLLDTYLDTPERLEAAASGACETFRFYHQVYQNPFLK